MHTYECIWALTQLVVHSKLDATHVSDKEVQQRTARQGLSVSGCFGGTMDETQRPESSIAHCNVDVAVCVYSDIYRPGPVYVHPREEMGGKTAPRIH